MKTKSTPQGGIDYPVDPIAFALGAGATFVARTVDVDAPHLQEILRRAHAHRGTAFVEILQNCPVYNDNEWEEVEDRKTRSEAALVLEDGAPLVFGAKGQRSGIRIQDGVPSVVQLTNGEDPVARGVAVHREGHETPAYAFALATLSRPRFPIPIGVFRSVAKPTYESLLEQQVSDAVARSGAGDLAKLLHSGDTWTVEA
jgi:2-oxoglutarate ferredoxin oxidoreductase subunit beta